MLVGQQPDKTLPSRPGFRGPRKTRTMHARHVYFQELAQLAKEWNAKGRGTFLAGFQTKLMRGHGARFKLLAHKFLSRLEAKVGSTRALRHVGHQQDIALARFDLSLHQARLGADMAGQGPISRCQSTGSHKLTRWS